MNTIIIAALWLLMPAIVVGTLAYVYVASRKAPRESDAEFKERWRFSVRRGF